MGAGGTEEVREGTGEVEKEGSVEGTGEAGEMGGTGEGADDQRFTHPATEGATKEDGATKEGAAGHTISPRG